MNEKYIVCPNCGYEYVSSEIVIPTTLFGKPEYIERDNEGKIIDYIGLKPDYKDYFYCENCNTGFSIITDITYNVKIEDKMDFDHDYETRLN